MLALLEAEVRELRRGALRLAVGVVLIGLSGILVLGGVVLLIWSLHLFVGRFVEPPGASLISGMVVFLMAGGLLWIARQLNR